MDYRPTEQQRYKEIYFTNQNYSFEFFYKSMTETLSELIKEKNLYKCNKRIFSFMANFIHAVVNEDHKVKLQDDWLKLSEELEEDEGLKKLIKYDQEEIDISVPYTKKFYYYYIKHISFLSEFLTALDRTYMPTTDLDKTAFRFRNYHAFFYTYISLKQLVTDNLSSYSIEHFQTSINSCLVFYFGYNQYVTFPIRNKIDKVIEKLVEYITNDDFLKVVMKEYKTSRDIQEIRDIKWNLNKIIQEIYNMVNKEHSLYNLIPKVQQKIYIDSTSI